ncbi:MAG TPA: glycosyltransferase [Saprospiraceae bacterium]|nr:glycosyltransferase [Saprospiraceae bacterium]
MKKFLLITYYWPPAGGAGVMRWAKMSKYISQYGWEPVIYTPSNGEVPVHDESLVKEIPPHLEIVKTPIWEPYNLYKTFLGRKKKDKLYSGFINEKKKASLSQKISVFIRGNFFIPDARMFWIKPSVRFLKKYLQENHVDAIVSTGPPHSMHLIAERIHKATGIPWIADFRDPWTNIDFYQDLKLTAIADKRHKTLEKKVLRNATKIVTVTWRSRDEFRELINRDDIVVIPNGFDDADFPSENRQPLDEKFTLVYVGSMNKDRNPASLWSALQQLLTESTELRNKLKINILGPVDFSVRDSIEKTGLNSFTEFIEFMPHNEAVRKQQQAQVLLLLINNTPNAKTIIPGKLYEYLGSGRPILAIGPRDSDSAKVITMTQGGVVHEFNDIEGLKARILEYFELYKKGDLKGNADDIQKFTRRTLSKEYAKVLSEIAK